MFFSKNKPNPSNNDPEQSKLWEHIKSMEVKLVKLEAENQKIDQMMRSLRGFINKKYKLETTEEEVLKEEPTNDGFDFLRVG